MLTCMSVLKFLSSNLFIIVKFWNQYFCFICNLRLLGLLLTRNDNSFECFSIFRLVDKCRSFSIFRFGDIHGSGTTRENIYVSNRTLLSHIKPKRPKNDWPRIFIMSPRTCIFITHNKLSRSIPTSIPTMPSVT